jgi:hypothetical protein
MSWFPQLPDIYAILSVFKLFSCQIEKKCTFAAEKQRGAFPAKAG